MSIVTWVGAPAAVCLAALGIVLAPTANADRTCTNTSSNTTICSRPGGSTSINTSPPPVGPYTDCGFGVGMDYMCGGGVTWNIGGVFRNRR